MTTTLKDWILDGIKIFIIIFVIGKLINRVFKDLQNILRLKRSIIYGLIHLLFILVFAFYLHNFTSDKFSHDFGISNPSILFSGLFISLQNNLFYNLGINNGIS